MIHDFYIYTCIVCILLLGVNLLFFVIADPNKGRPKLWSQLGPVHIQSKPKNKSKKKNKKN